MVTRGKLIDRCHGQDLYVFSATFARRDPHQTAVIFTTNPFLHHKDVLTKCFITAWKGVSPYRHIHTGSAAHPVCYPIAIGEFSMAVSRKKAKLNASLQKISCDLKEQ
jgi:hypothetical protein